MRKIIGEGDFRPEQPFAEYDKNALEIATLIQGISKGKYFSEQPFHSRIQNSGIGSWYDIEIYFYPIEGEAQSQYIDGISAGVNGKDAKFVEGQVAFTIGLKKDRQNAWHITYYYGQETHKKEKDLSLEITKLKELLMLIEQTDQPAINQG